MAEEHGNIPLPDEVPIPLDVVQQIIAAGERAIDALTTAGISERAGDLDNAIRALSIAVLRHIGLWDDGE